MLYIVKDNDRWKIEGGPISSGPYSTRTEAIQAAVAAASDVASNGSEAEIMAQIENPSTWEKVWSSAGKPVAAE